MKTTMECWAILESCLEAPEGKLPKGASLEAIKEFEAATKVTLPESLRDFYLKHDGTGDCFIGPYEIGGGDQGFLSLQQSLDEWRTKCEVGLELEKLEMFGEQEGPIRKKAWHNKWIPITENGNGDYIYIDFDPTDKGTVGQIVDWWHELSKSTLLETSFIKFLNKIADKVKAGKYKFQFIG